MLYLVRKDIVEKVRSYRDDYPNDDGRRAYEIYISSNESIGRLGDELIHYIIHGTTKINVKYEGGVKGGRGS